MNVHTTEKDLNDLASAIDGARKNSKDVKVPRQALANLLCDAGVVFTILEKEHKLKHKGDA
jgi:hypothetical protein